MHTRRVSSLQHPFVKELSTLRKEAKERYLQKKCLIMGKTMIEEIGRVSPILSLVVRNDLPPLPLEAEEIVFATDQILSKITGLSAHDGYAALVRLPEAKKVKNDPYLVALDQINDPGNLGTLFRSAFALGWDRLILLEGGCDPFNDKALRSGKGAQFFLPFTPMRHEEFLDFAKKGSYSLVLADLQGQELGKSHVKAPLVLVLGNEKRGPHPLIAHAGQKLKIPMQEGADSLNVASAGAILLYTLRGHHG